MKVRTRETKISLAHPHRDSHHGGMGLKVSSAKPTTGNLLRVQGDMPGALAAYRAGLLIDERLAHGAPDNAVVQRDLFVSAARGCAAFSRNR